MQKVSVIGAGAWGTALAITSHRAGRDVTIYARESEVVDSVNETGENKPFLRDVPLDKGIKFTNNLQDIKLSDLVIIVVPSQYIRNVAEDLSRFLPSDTIIAIASKGIEQNTLCLMSDVISEYLKNPIAIISGPNFARQTALAQPSATTVACEKRSFGEAIVQTIASTNFRPYLTDDIIGVQIGGAVKNVIAIACGIAEGKGMGDNARAALITRGLAEISRLCVAKGGCAETLLGLSGVGDLVLTCSSINSRNMSLGVDLGKGRHLKEILNERNTVAEGVATAKSIYNLATSLSIEMPICTSVYNILYEGADIDATIKELLEREYKDE